MKAYATIVAISILSACTAMPAKNAGMTCTQEWETVSYVQQEDKTVEFRSRSCSRWDMTTKNGRANHLRDIIDVRTGE